MRLISYSTRTASACGGTVAVTTDTRRGVLRGNEAWYTLSAHCEVQEGEGGFTFTLSATHTADPKGKKIRGVTAVPRRSATTVTARGDHT